MFLLPTDPRSCFQFTAYVRSYLAAHPELAEVEFPTFDDFDMNKDGLVRFTEWKEFTAKLEEEQVRGNEFPAGDDHDDDVMMIVQTDLGRGDDDDDDDDDDRTKERVPSRG
jgi:hypothetical protein